MEGQHRLFVGGTPEKGYRDYKLWHEFENDQRRPSRTSRIPVSELVNYEVDVHAHMVEIAPMLMERGISLKSYAAILHAQWHELTRQLQAQSVEINSLSILHDRLQPVMNGTEPEPEAVVTYFVKELENSILKSELIDDLKAE